MNDTDDMNVLKDANMNDRSYSDLTFEIYRSTSSINLETDYKYNTTSDQDCAIGVNINKNNFVVNGNGHTIDCDNKARAFNITGKNVEINNLIIKNGLYQEGSAISSTENLKLNNVTFINCNGNGKDDFNVGAVVTTESELTVNNCKFINTSEHDGASISAYFSDVKVVNSTFISSSDKIIKGQIFLSGSNATVEGSSFLNTTSRYATAIFARNEESVTISNTKFKNLHANKTAGAIATTLIDRISITDSEFDNVTSANNGGAIFIDSNRNKKKTIISKITHTVFNNCYSGFGGAILQLGGNLNYH